MEERNAGSTDLKLSVLGLGCWQFGSAGEEDYWGLEFTDELATSLTRRACELGFTYFDTAEDYGKGASESQLGRALASLDEGTRAKCVIGSKILPNNCGDVRAHCEGTLARLGVPAIDLYMVHWPIDQNSMAHFSGAHTASGGRDYASTGDVAADAVPPARKAFLDLAELQREGKVKHVGVSNFGVAQLQDALSTGVKIAANQLCYNLIFRAAELEVTSRYTIRCVAATQPAHTVCSHLAQIIPFCAANGIGVLAYSPLMQA